MAAPAKTQRTEDLYSAFLAERDEIMRHKWIESERLGHDIGFERALAEWTHLHRPTWRAKRSASPKATI